MKNNGQKNKRGGAKPSAMLSDLRWIRTRRKWLEEDTRLINKEREGSTASFCAKNVVHVCVIAEVASAWVCVHGALGEDMFACESATALACDVVVGEGAVFEGVHQESVMFAFFVLFVLLLLFSGEKSKIQKSIDYFSKANPSTFSILFFMLFNFFLYFFRPFTKIDRKSVV